MAKAGKIRKFTSEMGDKLAGLTIRHGAHNSPHEGTCIMEAVAFVTRQRHTDQPGCVSETLVGLLIGINDSRGSNKERDKLKEVVPFIVGTCPIREEKRHGQVIAFRVKTAGYEATELRRKKRLVRELDEYIPKSSKAMYPNPESLVGHINYTKVATEKAIEVAKILAKMPNRV